MAGEPLSWVFELFDKISGPASAMAQSTVALQESINKLTEKIDKLGQHEDKHKEHSEGFRHALFETVLIAKEVGATMFEVGEKIADFGMEALNAAGGTEQIKIALEGMIGNKGEVDEFLERLEKFAPSTAFTDGKIRSFGTDLIRSGFKTKDVQKPLLAALDVGALNPENQEGSVREALALMGNIQTVGAMTERSLMGLKSLRVSVPDVTANLAEAYGVKTTEVKKLIEGGKIDAAHGLAAIEAAIAKKGGGVLGANAGKMADTLPALMTRLKAFPESIFENLDKSPAFAKVKLIFRNVLDALDANKGPLIKAVSDTFGAITSAIFGDLSGPTGKAKLENIFGKITKWIQGLPGKITAAKAAFMEFYGEIKAVVIIAASIKAVTLAVEGYVAITKLATAATAAWEIASFALNVALAAGPLAIIPLIIGAVAAVGFVIYEVIKHWDFFKKYLTEFFNWIYTTAVSIGSRIWQGMKAGIVGGFTHVKDAALGLASHAIDTVSDTLSIQSPSKVFEKLGMYSAQGFAQGVDKGGGLVGASLDDTFGLDSPKASIRGGGTYSTQIEINVNAGDHADGDDIAIKIKDILPGALATAFEQMALEAGAA